MAKVSKRLKALRSSVEANKLYGFYKPVKNLTLRAGVYNVFNRNRRTI